MGSSVNDTPAGRFAPSPTGRMHLGNIFAAYASYRSIKSRGGKWILRIEDLDRDRSRLEYAKWIEDDLQWLGLEWDEGGLENKGPNPPYIQSGRTEIYRQALRKLADKGLVYPCRCTRADIRAASAPHQSDGEIRYPGTCRPATSQPATDIELDFCRNHTSLRLMVPDSEIEFTDRIKGTQRVNLTATCGDFIIRRADGIFAYQLAVAVDDAMMGITEVVRGEDLLTSTPRQIHILRLLNLATPEYAHIPLLLNSQGIRLSKRDHSQSMEHLRRQHTPSSLRQLLESYLPEGLTK
ncbi:MAG: tRNA glutamyl-Q(34) synthetase GluQRS [Muribaculum sp.]|nr:tRNA glutamyl-Q(34) synthetase GluQRS [Muribaculum sp.]